MGGSALLFCLGVLACAVRPDRRWVRLVYGLSAVTSAGILIGAIIALFSSAAPSTVILPVGLPWIGSHLRLDTLSAFFLIVINFGGAVAGLYGIGYGVHEGQPRRVLPFFPVFIAAMNLVVVADDAFTFLVAWEVMSLTSWALVMSASPRDKNTSKAGLIYLVMAGFGAFMLLFAFGIMAGTDGGYSFAAIRGHDLPAWSGAMVLVLAILGTGSKAGIFPLHVWLPLAHPAAPSHVSSLMSGVMTKVAIYGFIRIIFDLAGSELVWWWSIPVLVVGGVTAVLGVLYALMQHDLKKLLAYHTVENIGIIFIGLGLAMAFHANRLDASAAVAMVAALLHVFNHSLFKSLLFMGSGAIIHATRERDIDRMGGLIHKMPVTAFLFLVGSVAISALPPFNGFVSEWMIFQSILSREALPQAALTFLFPAIGAMLALAAALAATCFVKAFGITFLGRARTERAEKAVETDKFSLGAMAILASLCLLIGILPTFAVQWISPVTEQLFSTTFPVQGTGTTPLSLVPFSPAQSSYNGFFILAFLLVSGSLSAWFIHRFASGAVRRGPAWDCGTPATSPASQYTSASFSQPIRRIFGGILFLAREEVDMPLPGDTRAAGFTVKTTDPAWALIFTPLASLLKTITDGINFLQFLTVRRFLSLMFAALVILLIVVAIWN